MSAREELANRIADWIRARKIFNASYGVIQDTRDREDGPGMARTVKFGIEGILDAELVIWNAKRLDLQVSLIPDWVNLTSESEFYQFCIDTFPAFVVTAWVGSHDSNPVLS